MRWREIELFVVCTFLMLTIAEFIQVAVQIRIFGPNLLHPRIWQYLVIFVILVSNSQAFLSKPMFIVYIYSLLYIMLGLVGHYIPDRYWMIGKSPLHFLQVSWAVTVLLRVHYFRPEKVGDLRIILKVAWFAIILACLTSLLVIARNPGAVRGTDVAYYEEDVRSFRGIGLGGYGFFSALPFIVPIIYYFLKDSMKNKNSSTFLLTLLLILVMYTLFKGIIMAPFLIAIAALLLSAMGRRRFKSSLTVLLLIVITFALLPNAVIGGGLMSISKIVPNVDMSQKFMDLGVSYISGVEIAESSEGSGNSVEHRASRIAINLEMFTKHPLIGAGTPGNTHLHWLYVLAHFGLIGALPLFWLIMVLFKYIEKFEDEYKFYYFLSFLSFLVLLFVKAFGGYHFLLTVFFIAPGSYYLNHEFPQRVQVDSPRHT